MEKSRRSKPCIYFLNATSRLLNIRDHVNALIVVQRAAKCYLFSPGRQSKPHYVFLSTALPPSCLFIIFRTFFREGVLPPNSTRDPVSQEECGIWKRRPLQHPHLQSPPPPCWHQNQSSETRPVHGKSRERALHLSPQNHYYLIKCD